MDKSQNYESNSQQIKIDHKIPHMYAIPSKEKAEVYSIVTAEMCYKRKRNSGNALVYEGLHIL